MPPQFSRSAPGFGGRLVQFEADWNSGQIPDVAGYLRQADDGDREFIEDLIEVDLECRWKQFDVGSDPSAKDPHGFPLFPLVDDYASVLPQSMQQMIFTPYCVAEEYRVRSRWGDKPKKESFLERFPSDRTAIEAALQQIDIDFENEGIQVEEEPSRPNTEAARATVILGQSPPQDSKLVPEEKLKGTLVGKYKLETRLGHGGFGEVWKAYDAGLKRQVAIKFPRSDKQFPAEQLELFRTEAQKLAQLGRIPGVVNVFDCDEQDGKPYFVSDYIEGASLADRMQQEQLTHEESAALIAKVAETLKRAHQQKLVHRDIKPANILLDQEGEPYVADFGMAATEEEQLSEQGGICGTYAYMAPEQARGDSHRVDGRADIYALGVILYRLLTNELPYGGKTTQQYLDNIQHQNPRPPRQIDETIPAELERICLKCLEKDENRRYSSAGELASELEQSTKRPSGFPTRTVVMAAAVPVLCILFGLVFLKSQEWFPLRSDWRLPEHWVYDPINDWISDPGYNPNSKAFEFETNGPSLFKVGESDEEEMILNVRFRVRGNERIGQGGVFWMGSPVNGVYHDKRIDACCWVIKVGRRHPRTDFSLVIEQHQIGPSGSFHMVLNKCHVANLVLEEPLNPILELSAVVTASAVKQITLNGEDVIKSAIPLEAEEGLPWSEFTGTGYGYLGQRGSFAIEMFSIE